MAREALADHDDPLRVDRVQHRHGSGGPVVEITAAVERHRVGPSDAGTIEADDTPTLTLVSEKPDTTGMFPNAVDRRRPLRHQQDVDRARSPHLIRNRPISHNDVLHIRYDEHPNHPDSRKT